MKGIFVILDGLGGLPNKKLDGKTPLEAASIPNLNFLATRGELGLMYPVKPGFIPESDESIVSIFGNKLINSSRGQLEARGAGLELKRGDLALRVNFSTVDAGGNIKDRRTGRTLTSAEAESLAEALNEIKLPCKFDFVSTIQHRAVVVFRGGFSDNFSGNDKTYIQGRSEEPDKISLCRASDDDENTIYTVNLVNEFLRKAYDVLKKHPLNKLRKEKGLLPANYLLIRNPGIEKPKLKQYPKWVSANYMPLEIGFSNICGMKNFSFSYPKLKGLDSYKNLYNGLRKACKFSIKVLKRNYKKADYAYIHLKETDLPGHDNKPLVKKEMIEHIDRTFFAFLRRFCPPNKIQVVVTGDHSTPCKLKNHSADPVPVLWYNLGVPREKKFNEEECQKGSLGKFMGSELFKKVGFDK